MYCSRIGALSISIEGGFNNVNDSVTFVSRVALEDIQFRI